MSRNTLHLLACLLAGLSFGSLAAPPASSALLAGTTQNQALPQIAVDVHSRQVAIDTEALSRLAAGQEAVVAIAGVGRFGYVIDYVLQDAEVLEIGGHLAGAADHKITLGLRAEGLTGLISTPGQVYAIGYADRIQHVGPAGPAWLDRELAGQGRGIARREPARGEQPPVPGAEPVTVDLARLAALVPGDDVVMQLPGLGTTRVAFQELRPGDGSGTWVGYLKDFGESYPVLLTFSPAGTEGHLLTPMGEIHLTANGDGDLYLFNPTQLGYRNAQGEDEACAVQAAPPSLAAGMAAGPLVEQTAAADTTDQTIDVLVYYTPGMVSVYGSAEKVAARVDALIALANQAYTAGGLARRLRRVGLELLDVADTSGNSALLDQMRLRSGPFTGLDARRDQLGADLVSIVRPFYKTAQGSCGVAYVSGAGGSDVSLYERYGLAVISDGVDRAGSNYYCDNLTFAHELGHNMGLMHDRTTVASQGGGTGAKPYAFGYAVTGRWGTIMSYTFPHQVKFSNPLDYTCNGSERCGVPSTAANSADNVLALGMTMPLVAAFRGAVAATAKYSVTGIVSLNGQAVGGATLVVSNLSGAAADQVSCQASGSNGAYACTAPAGAAFTLTPKYSGAAAGTTITWTPASANIGALKANQVVNFSGKANGTVTSYQVAGTVKLDGAPLAGAGFLVTVPAGQDASRITCSTATASGSYACKAPAGATFTLTPKVTGLPAGTTVTWSPASATFSAIGANRSQNFAGTRVVKQYAVTIAVTVNGTPSLAVPLMLSAPAGTDLSRVSCAATARSTIACQVPSGYTMTVSPLLTAAVVPAGRRGSVSPGSRTVAQLAADQVLNFAVTVK
jgi:plastocyanin